MHKRKSNVTSVRPSIGDTVLKLSGPLLTIFGLIVGALQFTAQLSNNDKMEFKRRIWEKRLDAYMELGNLTARIVTSTHQDSIKRLSVEFEKVYWGKLPLFEDDSVERAMKRFRNEIHDKAEGIEDSLDNDRLTEKGYLLMLTCKRSLKRSWEQLEEDK